MIKKRADKKKATPRIDLTADLGFMKMRNPLLIASGTFGYGEEYGELVPLNILGGFVSKGTTLKPREGNSPPRIWETASGVLNAIGLQNPGLDVFMRHVLPKLKLQGARLVVNVAGEGEGEYVELARRLSFARGVDALEVNISCPNVAEGGISFGRDAKAARGILGKVVAASRKPIIAKLTPNTAHYVEVALAAQEAGCAAVSLTNTFLGMAINLATERPALANVRGGLSGPAIKPLSLHQVYAVAAAVDVPVIGIGGISTGEDAVEFLLAGAAAVQVGTALMSDPRAPGRIVEGIKAYMKKRGYGSLADFAGKANPEYLRRRITVK